MSTGYIYILTNPSFPDYVKIGYADDVNRRLKQLNNSECTPFAFRVYATYEVSSRLQDKKLHALIDSLNPNLRSIDKINGKVRVREFYAMSAEDAYSILEAIAGLNGFEEKLKKWELTEEEKADEATANEVRNKTERFAFSLCNIPIGSRIEWYKDTDIFCTVIDDHKVDFNGEIMSLTAVAKRIIGKKDINIAGPKYFRYNGEMLNDIREKLGNL